MTKGPLAGVRVIEIESIGPTPFACMLLADMGCEIVRVETPKPRQLRSPFGDQPDPLMRGRANVTIDLKDREGQDQLLAAVARADVLIEGLRPGKMEALGLGPDNCFAQAPHLVYARITGWGQAGPQALSAGHDPNYLASTGALFCLGDRELPRMPPFGIVGDVAAGSLYLVMGVLAALHHARSTGKGQVVDASILDGHLSLMTTIFAMQRAGLYDSPFWSALTQEDCPYARNYRCADGRYVTVCPLEPAFYQAMLDGLKLSPNEMPDRNDMTQWPALREILTSRFSEKTRDEWHEIFDGSDACVSAVLQLDEANQWSQNRDRGSFVDGLPAAAPKFSHTPTDHAAQSDRSGEELLKKWMSDPARG